MKKFINAFLVAICLLVASVASAVEIKTTCNEKEEALSVECVPGTTQTKIIACMGNEVKLEFVCPEEGQAMTVKSHLQCRAQEVSNSAQCIDGKTVNIGFNCPGKFQGQIKVACPTAVVEPIKEAPIVTNNEVVVDPVPSPEADTTPNTATPSVVKIDLGLNAGAIGYNDFVNVFGSINLGVEFRLTQNIGVTIDADFGGGGGVIEDPRSSMWSTGVGVALWATDHVRVVFGAGYRGVRNASWNFSLGGPQGFIDARFLLGESGFAIGTRLASGPMWDYTDQLSGGWEATVGFGWVFGGPRQ